MPFFSILFFIVLAMLAAILFATWLGSLVIFGLGRRRGSRAQTLIGSVPFALTSLLGLWLVYLCFAPPNPTNSYKDSFGAAPSDDVTEMRSSEDGFGDWAQTFLKFKTSPATIKRITVKGWTLSDANQQTKDDDATSPQQEGTPSWWKPTITANTQIFYAEHRLGHFNTVEREELIYNVDTRETYYSYDGLD